MKILVTGSSGLIGSAAVRHFDRGGEHVFGVDNNMRKVFFGDDGDTSWQTRQLKASTDRFTLRETDIRDIECVFELFENERFDAVIHCAAQPSHDKASEIPLTDFDVNAVGTLNLLEANRQYSPEAPFVFTSTNKVYGDAPNDLELIEQDKRWEFADPEYQSGISEDFRIDRSKHSIFGASKVAADIMVQEYGQYFDMPTCCLRGGCLTGPAHAGVELHGFLSYLIKCNLERRTYTIFGYKGKQVRDNIHAYDVVRFMEAFIDQPKRAAVYNLGGGKANSTSILEAFERVENITGIPMQSEYSDEHRSGDHVCYYSDLGAIRSDYPNWEIEKDLQTTFEEIVEGWQQRLRARANA